jgi:hypothetical protein
MAGISNPNRESVIAGSLDTRESREGWNWLPGSGLYDTKKRTEGQSESWLRSFSLRIHNFGKTLAKAAVVIDLGEPKILIRHVPQPFEAPRDGQLPRPHIFQEPLNVLFVHRS